MASTIRRFLHPQLIPCKSNVKEGIGVSWAQKFSPPFFRSLHNSRGLSTTTTVSPSQGDEDFVIIEKLNHTGIIKFNRPGALNVINLPMIRKIDNQIRKWEIDPETQLMVIKSAKGKAFCAGGDVKAMMVGRASGYPEALTKEVYIVGGLIGSLSTPYIALVDGVWMGAGVGVSVHAPFRIVTERAVFAMPETAIGFFPDCGISHIFSRLSGKLGYFMGLTGHRLLGADIFKAGIATHFVPSDKMPSLEEELLRLKYPDRKTIDALCSDFQERYKLDDEKEFNLNPYLEQIGSAFGVETVEQIIENLKRDSSEFGKRTLKTLQNRCPMSLKVTLEQIKRGATLTLAEAIKMEYRICFRLLERHDFYEGVRAVLIDKDQNPKWNPSRIENVTQEMVDKCFELLPPEKEIQF